MSYLPGTVESSNAALLVAWDVAESLITLGWPLLPYGPEMDRWQIGAFILTDDELIELSLRYGAEVLIGVSQVLTQAGRAAASQAL